MTPGYDISTPAVLPVQPCEVRTNMIYDTGPHTPRQSTVNPPPPEPEGDAPIVVTRSE